MSEATSPPSLPSASNLSPCGLSNLRLGPPPWELRPDPPELEDSDSELFLLWLEGGSSPKWTLSALLPPLTELARLLVDWALLIAGKMSEVASSRSKGRRRFWKTMGSEPRDPSPTSSGMRLPTMHCRAARGERWMGVVTECSDFSSSGMETEGAWW